MNNCIKICNNAVQLSGPEFINYNDNNLVYLLKDVANFRPLELFTGYPFENHLQILKNLVRRSKLLLQKVVKRVGELQNNSPPSSNGEILPNVLWVVTREHFDGRVIETANGKQYSKSLLGHWNLSKEFPK